MFIMSFLLSAKVSLDAIIIMEKIIIKIAKTFIIHKVYLFYFNFNVKALIATITVLKDINIAPTAGDNINPIKANAPAAKGTATIL